MESVVDWRQIQREDLRILKKALGFAVLAFVCSVLTGLRGSICFALDKKQPLDGAKGYIESIDQEEEIPKDFEIPIPKNVSLRPQTQVSDQIFTTQLAAEFRSRYEQTFGRTAAEQIYNFQSNPYELQTATTANIQYQGYQMTGLEMSSAQRKFGEYMGRRLLEYHVDAYFRNDPKIRPVYEFKEKVSKVKVEVSPGYTFNAQYSFSGNYFDVIFNSPVVRAVARMEGDEVIVTLQSSFTKTISGEEYYAVKDGIQKVVLRKQLNSVLGTNLLVSTFTKPEGQTARESLYLAGLQYIF